jgi:hypothetical protein
VEIVVITFLFNLAESVVASGVFLCGVFSSLLHLAMLDGKVLL